MHSGLWLVEPLSATLAKSQTNTCYRCPIGGRCENGIPSAMPRYWGYQVGDKIIFIHCPVGYCCQKLPCTMFNSCNIGRNGPICSDCALNFSIDLASGIQCRSKEICSSDLFWIFGILTVLGFTLFFFSGGDIYSLYKFVKMTIQKTKLYNSKVNTHIVNMEEREKYKTNNHRNRVFKFQFQKAERTSFSDLWPIIVYHIQDARIFHVYLANIDIELAFYFFEKQIVWHLQGIIFISN